MSNPLEHSDVALSEKIGHALNRISTAMRADTWDMATDQGLTPTQGQIIGVLANRRSGLRLSKIAAELVVSPPTVSDSIATLAAKGLVKKQKAKDDGRAIAVSLTAAGRRLSERLSERLGEQPGDTSGAVATALAGLTEPDQQRLFETLTKVIHSLQEQRRIPVGRMCVTCRYFQAGIHSDPQRPHHCALVDAPFGNGTLRVDCPEHERAAEDLAQKNWTIYTQSGPSEADAAL